MMIACASWKEEKKEVETSVASPDQPMDVDAKGEEEVAANAAAHEGTNGDADVAGEGDTKGTIPSVEDGAGVGDESVLADITMSEAAA